MRAINPVEAKTIKSIFRLYLERGCVNKLNAAADAAGLRSHLRTRLDGADHRRRLFLTRPSLRDPAEPDLYRPIVHKGQTYSGAYEAIVDAETWDAMEAQLAANRKARRHGTNAKEPGLLAGLLFDADGDLLTPSHSVKNGKRYRY